MHLCRAFGALACVALILSGCAPQDGSESDAHQSIDPQAGVPALASIPLQAPLDSILAVGIDHYYAGAYPQARAYLEESSRRAVLIEDTASWSNALTWLGLVARMEHDYAGASRFGERALELARLAGLEDQMWRPLNLLGLVAWEESRLEEAVDLFARVMDEAARSGQTRGISVAAGNRGLVYEALGELELARVGFEAMYQGGVVLADTLLIANALTNLGMLSVRTGDVGAAITYLEEAVPLQLTVNAYGAENAIGQLGTAYALAGDLGAAYARLDSAASLSRSLGMRGEEGENLRMLADLYRDAGDRPRALRTYAVARSILDEAGWRIEAGAALRSEAEVLAEQGDLRRARERVELALETHELVGALPESLRDHLALAEIDAREGRWADSQKRLSDAAQLAERVGARRERIAVALSRARVADAANDAAGILSGLADAGDLAEWGPDTRWEGYLLRARGLKNEGRSAEAIDAGFEAVNSLERVRGTIGSPILRSSYSSARQRAYGDLVLSLLAVGRDEEAFHVSDAARGRLAAEHAAASPESVTAQFDAGAAAERERLLRRIDLLLDSLNASPDSERARRQRLDEARVEYEAFQVRAMEQASHGDVRQDAPPSIQAIRSALVPGEALLQYLVTPDTLVAFVVGPMGLSASRTAIRAENLASRVRLAREMMKSAPGGGRGPPGTLESLFRTLIQPALDMGALDDVERLIVVPHGVLSYLPFAALRNSERGEYLVEQFTLASLPTAGSLPHFRERAAAPGASSGTAFAPFPQTLPGSRTEVDAIQASIGALPRLGQSSTEASVRAALAASGIVHLATHGVMNARSPLFSRVELAPGVRARSDDDGRLEVHEILALRVAADLVFLSGCETALGPSGATRFEQGEDFTTLAQSLLVAGADVVVATLWQVGDASAAEAATLFYEGLPGVDPSTALARAQRAMIAHADLSEPFHWASYVVSGVGGAWSPSKP